MEDHFTQKEMLTALMRKVEETHDTLLRQGTRLDQVLEQALKTNGRVTKLEEEVDAIQLKTENLGVKVAAGVFVATIITAELVRAVL